MHAGLDGRGGPLVGNDRAERDAAGHGFSGDHDVGQQRRVQQLVGKVRTRAADAALNLVKDQQSVMFSGKSLRAAGKLLGDWIDAALALDELEDNAGCVFGDGRLERGNVIPGNEARTGKERFEVFAVLRLPGDGKRSQSSTVEGVVERDDLGLLSGDGVAVGAKHLQRPFHRFRSGIAEEGALKTADFSETLGEPALVFVIVQIGGMQEQPGLLANDLG